MDWFLYDRTLRHERVKGVELAQQTYILVSMCQRRLEDVFRLTIFQRQDFLEDDKLLRFITTTGNRFVISLGFSYVLHHC